ncbi:class I SAM-dependent methyltransferase [Brevibacterium sp. RIT 803]|uniref:class I SAM-dependent methyltransferase n=1 Tax=Brevibacterium sp. RIT 803 TaxID=2810210 RepID=UPI00194EA60C|nr:class I SAM-dependent methyltransferase [Brevibacterium sp. RIT 803]MBM6589443.1 methyltransferase domain-containing protein [Brevibacterium sp. RIT 803]
MHTPAHPTSPSDHNSRYLLGESEGEHQRLRDQAVVLDPLTRLFLADSEICPGMRVLDLGTGAGSVAAIAADLVGEEGRVLAVDRDANALEAAQRALSKRPQVEFAEMDLRDLDLDEEFDAVIGRAVLMHLPDPVAVLRRAADHVRPGGLLCMHELDVTHQWTSVSTPLWAEVRSWIFEVFGTSGVHMRMGPDLFAAFRRAGLPDPHLTVDAPVGGGDELPTFGWANVVEALVPIIGKLGIATADEIDIATLTERLCAEIDAADGIVLGPILYGATCTIDGGDSSAGQAQASIGRIRSNSTMRGTAPGRT